MNNLYILKLGGSLVVPTWNKFDEGYLGRLKHTLELYIEKGMQFVIIVGGGKICRWYQDEGRRLMITDNEDLNWIGAYVTRVNAEVVNSFFKPLSHERSYYDFDQPIKLTKPILVVGAWKPGKSTNMDAVLMAEKFSSRTIINLSDIDHVYDKDPKKYPEAKPLDYLTWSEYERIVGHRITAGQRVHQAGDNLPFDVIATQKAKEDGLKVIFAHGQDLPNFQKVLEGEVFSGTTIE